MGERPCPATQQLTADPRGVGTQRLQRGPLRARDTRPDVQLGVALLVVRRVVLPAVVWVCVPHSAATGRASHTILGLWGA